MANSYKNRNEEQRIFWVEVEKVKPNPMQPRSNFDEIKLKELAESIKQYGILQPLVVVRQEYEIPTGTAVDYELISGERRLRAAKIAGLTQVPVIIRSEPAEQVKLELSLIENVQREDLGPIERARAFKQLAQEFNLKHHEIAAKISKSREYVTNSIRLLSLPEEMQQALTEGRITEGHTRPLLMLANRPEEQYTLFKEIIYKQMTVRDAERISRRVAYDRARKIEEAAIDPQIQNMKEKVAEVLGTRVSIERKGMGGRISIEFFSEEELQNLLNRMAAARLEEAEARAISADASANASVDASVDASADAPANLSAGAPANDTPANDTPTNNTIEEEKPQTASPADETGAAQDEPSDPEPEDIIKSFTI